MSEVKLKDWVVEIDMYSDFTFAIQKVREAQPSQIDFRPFLHVQAEDELGAFAAAQVVLERLNFKRRRS